MRDCKLWMDRRSGRIKSARARRMGWRIARGIRMYFYSRFRLSNCFWKFVDYWGARDGGRMMYILWNGCRRLRNVNGIGDE